MSVRNKTKPCSMHFCSNIGMSTYCCLKQIFRRPEQSDKQPGYDGEFSSKGPFANGHGWCSPKPSRWQLAAESPSKRQSPGPQPGSARSVANGRTGPASPANPTQQPCVPHGMQLSCTVADRELGSATSGGPSSRLELEAVRGRRRYYSTVGERS